MYDPCDKTDNATSHQGVANCDEEFYIQLSAGYRMRGTLMSACLLHHHCVLGFKTYDFDFAQSFPEAMVAMANPPPEHPGIVSFWIDPDPTK